MKLNPMYLYHFLKDLGPLQAPNVPAPVELEPDVLVFGCLERAQAQQYVKELPENGKYFLLYSEKENVVSLSACDVTPQYEYLKRLDVMPYRLDNDKNQTELRAAVFEAVYLFGQLKELNMPELFAPYGDFTALQAMYTDNSLPDSTLPVLIDFADIPLNLQIFRNQFKYFFTLYLECRCDDDDALGGIIDSAEFENLVQDALSKLSDKTVCRRSKVFTDVENPEFDGFIQQIELMLPFHSELSLEMLRRGQEYLKDAATVTHADKTRPQKQQACPKEAKTAPAQG